MLMEVELMDKRTLFQVNARSLCNIDPENRTSLKAEGLLTRDPRVVERKKPGQKKAKKEIPVG